MLPNSVASNKRTSPSIEKALFKINARAFNRIFRVYLFHNVRGITSFKTQNQDNFSKLNTQEDNEVKWFVKYFI